MENDPDLRFQGQSPLPAPQPEVPPSGAPGPGQVTPQTAPAAPVVVTPLPDSPQQPVVSQQIVSPPPPNPPVQPTPYQPQDQEPQVAPRIKPYHYAIAGFGISIILAIFLPNSKIAQMLYIPILIFGAAGAIIFFIESIRTSRNSNIAARFFLISSGLGIGIVIFIISMIAALVVFTSKNPNPPPPS